MKNKWLAAFLNILPGAGYLYLGVRIPFAVILLLMLPVVIFAGIADPALSSPSSDSSSGFSWGVILILLTPAIAFVVDAFNEAGRVNGLRSAAKSAEKPRPAHEPKTVATVAEDVPKPPHKTEPHKAGHAAATDAATPFVVGPAKFVILSIITFSLYQVYWAYKNWKAVQAHEKSNIWPFWRALFSILFIYSLLNKLQAMLREKDHKADLSALDRSVIWISFSLASNLWKPLLILDLVKPFALMGVQKQVNKVYALDQKPSNRLSSAEWAVTICGLALTALVIIGLSLPPIN